MSTLELVSKKAKELLELEKLIDQKQAELKEVQNKYKKVSEEDIPSMLSELGLSEITLTDGSKINTAQYYSARITPDKIDEAFDKIKSLI